MKQTIQFFFYGLTFLLCASLMAGCNRNSSQQPEEISFHFNLPVDTAFRYIISNEQKVQSKGADMDFVTTIEVLYQKLKDSASLQIVKSTISRVAVNIHSPAMNISFDSRDGNVPKSSQSAIEPMFRLINKTYLLYLNEEGKIQDVKALSTNQGSSPDDSLLIQTLGKSFDFYPQRAVKIGDSWKTNTELLVQGINTSLKTAYTLKAVKGDTAILDVRSKLDAPERNLVMNGISMKITMQGTQDGDIKVLVSNGRLLHAGFSSNITGKFSAQGKNMKSTTVGKATITSKKEL